MLGNVNCNQNVHYIMLKLGKNRKITGNVVWRKGKSRKDKMREKTKMFLKKF